MGGGCLWELRPYWVKILPHQNMATAEDHAPIPMQCFRIWEKNPVLPIKRFPSLVLPGNSIMLQHLIQYPLYYLYRRLKTTEKFELLPPKSDPGGLHEASNIVIWLENFYYIFSIGKLVAEERWL